MALKGSSHQIESLQGIRNLKPDFPWRLPTHLITLLISTVTFSSVSPTASGAPFTSSQKASFNFFDVKTVLLLSSLNLVILSPVVDSEANFLMSSFEHEKFLILDWNVSR